MIQLNAKNCVSTSKKKPKTLDAPMTHVNFTSLIDAAYCQETEKKGRNRKSHKKTEKTNTKTYTVKPKEKKIAALHQKMPGSDHPRNEAKK